MDATHRPGWPVWSYLGGVVDPGAGGADPGAIGLGGFGPKTGSPCAGVVNVGLNGGFGLVTPGAGLPEVGFTGTFVP